MQIEQRRSSTHAYVSEKHAVGRGGRAQIATRPPHPWRGVDTRYPTYSNERGVGVGRVDRGRVDGLAAVVGLRERGNAPWDRAAVQVLEKRRFEQVVARAEPALLEVLAKDVLREGPVLGGVCAGGNCVC